MIPGIFPTRVFPEFVNTIYRTSKSPFGPWKKTKKDGIGGRRFYAAKSMQDDNGRRFYFAWAHDRAENSDRGEWYWGGTFCIPHEVVATEDGQLDVKLPEEYVVCFKEKVDWNYLPVMGEYKLYGDTTVELDGCGTTSYGFLEQPEEKFLFTGTVIPKKANGFLWHFVKNQIGRQADACFWSLMWPCSGYRFCPCRWE